MIKSNGTYLAVNWEASGGGAFAVIPLNEVGKSPDIVPLFRGHISVVLDTDFSPFNDRLLASSSDDGKIAIWEIPEDYSFFDYTDINGDVKPITPVKKLSGHLRKVGHVKFHPLADNILVSSSNDYTVKVWNIETGKPILSLQHKDLVTSFSFSYDGNKLATTCRDKKIRVWDLRTGELLQEGPGHSGAKNTRVVWLGKADRLATTGFSRLSDRQIGIWDTNDLSKGSIGGFFNIDSSAGILMPFFDDLTNILFVAGKGDGNIRYYEFTPENDELFDISEFQSSEPQRGFALAPKHAVNVKENEIVRAYKTVKDNCVEPISFIVPRRAEMFQFDLYPDAPSKKPALTAEEWVSGKTVSGPILFNMESLYDDDVEAVFNKTDAAAAAPAKKKDPKPEPKKPEPKQPESKEVTPVASPKVYQAPKASLDGLAEKKEVNDLLDKAKSLDVQNNVPEPSAWDDEPEPVKEQAKPKTIAKPTPPPAAAAAAVEKPKQEPKVVSEVVPKEDPKKEAEAPKEEPAASKAVATKGGATLKGTVEKLATLVDKLESHISALQVSNNAKDTKLEELEDKINKLLDK